MANTITLADLRTRCRERADMENSNFISPTELLSYINMSYAELYDLLVSRFEDYYLLDTELTIASGASTVSLPTDFYKLRGVDYQINSNEWIAVPKFNFNNRNIRTSNVSRLTSGQFTYAYRITGDDLRITPSDSANGTYRLWYIPIFTPLASESDTVNGVNGWEEYIIIDTAIKMLAKEESSTTHLEREKVAMLERIENMAQNRDVDQPEVISDVNNLHYNDDLIRGS